MAAGAVPVSFFGSLGSTDGLPAVQCMLTLRSTPMTSSLSRYEYDAEEDRWCDKDFDHPHIEPGSSVKFKIEGTCIAIV